ncbi:1,4-alpha-glucan branching protein GlgB [Aquisphaera insulae]|uniref:1,4-alpha-glucan branching protein GlgB n=1 Tax=Aquisphaera insulae TaxID=2712864 RepID=UPI0013EBE703|nr:1,4-alpha-glucan branching protein GlgB [Aquisphaera insulae]
MAVSTEESRITSQADVDLIVHAEHWNPFTILGPHRLEAANGRSKGWVVRAFLPEAVEAELIDLEKGEPGVPVPMEKLHPDGFFQVVLPDREATPRYRLRIENFEKHAWEQVDPYQFGPVLTDFDLHLLGEGTHLRNYDRLGAHLRMHEGFSGVHFAVWAPNAQRVSVVGNFNHWDGRRHQMRNRGATGIWEIFIPDLCEGEVYKLEIRSRNNGYLVQKSDPYGFAAEVRPKTASVVWDLSRYQWGDQDWMANRVSRQGLDRPLSVYEVHLGSWKKQWDQAGGFLTYRQLAHDLVAHLQHTHFTHVELLPITEHPFDGSWGYQPVGYFAPTSRHGSPDDFAYFVDTMHRNGFGVILDWVPAHFPSDLHGLGFFDGTHLYEHADPRLGEHRDWGTKIFNYGRAEVRNFLFGNALFWLDRYHLDGLRVDAVASMLYLDYSRKPGDWVPNMFGGNENLEAIDFLKRLNEICHQEHPGILTIAEESTSWSGVSRPTYLGGLGFSLKWNMGWMNDTLRYMSKDPVFRKYEHGALTFSMIYAFTENFILPLSHDEVVHGKGSLLDKMPGDLWQKFANLRLLYGYMYGHPGKKLLFMGDEIAQWREWNHDESLDWHLLQWGDHQGIFKLICDLNALYVAEKPLHEVDFDWQGYEWLELHDWENSVLAFLRRARDSKDSMVVICNFTPVVRENYRIGVPVEGFYREVLNTDAGHYGGSNVGNQGGVYAVPEPHAGKPYHLSLRVPPLGVLFLKTPMPPPPEIERVTAQPPSKS